MRLRRRHVVLGLVGVLVTGAVVAFANSLTVTSRNLDAKVTSTSLTTTSTSSTVVLTPNYLVTAPTAVSAGTSFNVTIQARLGTNNDPTVTGPQCVTFSGPANSPNGTAPTYPAAVLCGTGQSSVTFVAGSATVPVTLFKAQSSVTLTATSTLRAGTSGAFAVNSAGVGLSFTGACPKTHTKNTTQTYSLTVPNDAYGNAFTSNTGLVVNLTLSGADAANYKFLVNQTQTSSLSHTVATGPTNTSFSVLASGANKNATLNGSVTATGFTAPTSCNLVGTN